MRTVILVSLALWLAIIFVIVLLLSSSRARADHGDYRQVVCDCDTVHPDWSGVETALVWDQLPAKAISTHSWPSPTPAQMIRLAYDELDYALTHYKPAKSPDVIKTAYWNETLEVLGILSIEVGYLIIAFAALFWSGQSEFVFDVTYLPWYY